MFGWYGRYIEEGKNRINKAELKGLIECKNYST